MNMAEMVARYYELLGELDLEPAQCVLSGGGALAMMGLREEVADLDIDVPAEVYLRLKAEGYPVKVVHNPDSEFIKFNDWADIHCLEDSELRLKTAIGIQVTDGVGHYSPETMLMQKFWLNRLKDQEDINNLRALLKQR